MGSASKTFALFLILIIALSSLSLLVARSASAQSTPIPSVPQFTLTYVDNSHYVSPTYSIDPYTGKMVMSQEGYYQQNKSIEMTVTNQAFKPYQDANKNWVLLSYNYSVEATL